MSAKLKRPFTVIDLNVPARESPNESQNAIDWSRCVVCQKEKGEDLMDPCDNKRAKKSDGIATLSRNLKKFREMGHVPCNANVEALDGGGGIECNLKTNGAKWHKSCYLQCTDSRLQRLQAKFSEENAPPSSPLLTRSGSGILESTCNDVDLCVFCNERGTRGVPLVRISENGEKTVRECAIKKNDTKILVLLSGWQGKKGVWYHRQHYAAYTRGSVSSTRDVKSDASAHAEAFSEIVSHINQVKESSIEESPVFIMAQLARMYATKLEDRGITAAVHSSRLKEKLLAECSYLQSSGTIGQNILISFKKDLDESLRVECSQTTGAELYLDKAANILRKAIFSHTPVGWKNMTKEETDASTPGLLKYFVRKVLDGFSDPEDDDQAISSISQLVFFHARKKKRGIARRHDSQRETSVPVFLASKLYGATRSRELIDVTYHLGLSISYDRLKSILTQRANEACHLYNEEGVVCPAKMQRGVFTTANVDNIDHNTSSTTAKSAFHGTAISLMQHGPPGEVRHQIAPPVRESRKITGLPAEYSVVPLSFVDGKSARCPSSDLSCVETLFSDPYQDEFQWLESCRESATTNTWPGFHSRRFADVPTYLTRFSVLPLFREQANTMSMMLHSMDVVLNCTKHLNPSQVPVLVADQPLFTLCKEAQWLCPERFGEDKMFIMMGGMHIEKAAMDVLGDWLEGCGWTSALVQAGITTKGRAESMVSASHLTRTRYAHQVSAAVLHNLRKKAFEEQSLDDPVTFEQWCEQRRSNPQYRFWEIVLNLELIILQIVRATRTGNIELYIQALSRLVPWFFALDHQNYSRWLSVHIRDLLNLQSTHPSLWEEFNAGRFVAAKTHRRFSTIALDQAHEQLNAILKGKAGMIGLTEEVAMLLKMILFSPELAEIVESFEQNILGISEDPVDFHHFDTESARRSFVRDKEALEDFFDYSGNPFAEESNILYNIDTRRCCSENVIEAVMNIEKIGQEQYTAFCEERMTSGSVSIHQPIKKNRLPTFSVAPKATDKIKGAIKALKNENWLFGRLFVAVSNNRPGDLDLFFSHESHEYPPALFTNDGVMRSTNKAALLNDCLVPLAITATTNNSPNVTIKILDGGAIIHMLKPSACIVVADFVNKVFLPFLGRECKSIVRLDIVWDRYIQNSLKSSTREKRGEGPRTKVALDTKIPSNWNDFLRNSENKTELFALLAQSIREFRPQSGAQVFSTFGDAVVANTESFELSAISPCNHEEADTRVFVHLADAVQQGHSEALIRTCDTDVVVLAVSCFSQLPALKKLWVHVGTGKRHRYLAAHEMNALLGPEKSRALPAFHALTGCDNVSGTHGIGKKTWWKALSLCPQAIPALEQLGKGDVVNSKKGLEALIMTAYSPAKLYETITACRRAVFAKSTRSLDATPATEDALALHMLRASHQAQVWGQLTTAEQVIPCPSKWGWIKGHDGWQVVHKTKPTASEACKKLIVYCNCESACRGNCSCAKARVDCCDLCGCKCAK